MLLDILENDKIKLGKIINFYRTNKYRQENPNSWSINEFIKSSDDYICSNTTLSNIENGIIIKEDNIYDVILNKLGEEYNYEIDLSLEHEKYNGLMLESFRDFNEDRLRNTIDEYKTILRPYDKYVIEREYIRALDFIMSDDPKEKNSNLKAIVSLFSIYPDNLKEILQRNIFTFSTFHLNTENRRSIVKELNFKESNSPITRTSYVNYLIESKNYYDAFSYLLPIIDSYEREDNILGLVDSLPSKISLMAHIDSRDWVLEAENAIEFLDSNSNIPFKMKTSTIYSISTIVLPKKEYKLAFKILLLLLEKYSYLEKNTLLLLNVSAFLTDKPIPKKARLNDSNNEVFDTIHKFFILYEDNRSKEELETYITDNLIPLFKYMDRPTYDIFYDILEKLVDETGNRHLLYKYKQLRKRSYDD